MLIVGLKGCKHLKEGEQYDVTEEQAKILIKKKFAKKVTSKK